ncbi:nitronate monooxygenase [Microvirga sp. STS02]|uniref:NAD(P)H-dependent flavin oxidoreductase n=1 Tax=Hymenobacter negativus TaxID=2795026 RepID=UPI0018DCDFE0|nr:MULTISPECIES: nitronate monooxygenase family protein [Bacteria]MBH8570023.1 nitronate monooxygenase [Hymenobacter negativus]MBR7209763.1 nitronate monooxygenase [Microvirga sp. STS02]
MNAFCEQLGLAYPIIQAPMAGVSTVALAAAVSEAGALGSFATGAIPAAETVAQQLAELRAATSRPVNVNVFCHQPAPPNPAHDARWLTYLQPFFAALHSTPPPSLEELYPSFLTNDALLAVLVQARPRVVSFHFGLPTAAQLAALRQASCLLLACVTSPAEAQAAEAAGVDMLLAQGMEAGGHRGTFNQEIEPGISALDLTRYLVRHSRLPVVAAGGIMDGADIAAALQAGAVAAQLGTAFVACPESSASAAYRAALLHQPHVPTALTAVISGRPARGLVNRFVRDVDQPGRPPVAAYSRAYAAGKALIAAAQQANEPGFAVQWAGTGAGRARALPAAELVRTLATELQLELG